MTDLPGGSSVVSAQGFFKAVKSYFPRGIRIESDNFYLDSSPGVARVISSEETRIPVAFGINYIAEELSVVRMSNEVAFEEIFDLAPLSLKLTLLILMAHYLSGAQPSDLSSPEDRNSSSANWCEENHAFEFLP